jgi:nucleotide-binding universal stress UspA family protein
VAEVRYAKVVAGYEPNERGEDAVKLAELLADTVGAELRRVHVEQGSPAKELYELAERGEADLIVLGSTHRAALGRVTPGSVAEHLLSGARCRLAIAPRGYLRARALLAAEDAGEEADDVPAGSPMPAVRDELRVIGVGFDDTIESRVALEEAAGLASTAGASMRVIGVEPPPPLQLGPTAMAGALARPGALQTALHEGASGLPPELRALPVYERGDPAERLLEHAAGGMDLLVLGSRGFGPMLRLLLGSVAGHVIREAQCPVLVVPRPG